MSTTNEAPSSSISTLRTLPPIRRRGFDQHDVALPVEQPRQRHAGNARADDADAAAGRKATQVELRDGRGGGERFQELTTGPEVHEARIMRPIGAWKPALGAGGQGSEFGFGDRDRTVHLRARRSRKRKAESGKPRAGCHASERVARAKIPCMRETATVVFCDGAAKGNPGPGGWGVVIATADGFVTELGGRAAHTTNNKMELTAAIQALTDIAEVPGPVAMHTDSTYVIKGISEWIRGWRRRGWKTGGRRRRPQSRAVAGAGRAGQRARQAEHRLALRARSFRHSRQRARRRDRRRPRARRGDHPLSGAAGRVSASRSSICRTTPRSRSAADLGRRAGRRRPRRIPI